MTATQRARLVARAVPFIVPGNQLYLPDLAIDLREYFRCYRSRTAEGLSPSAQAVLFERLLRPGGGVITPSALADRLYFTAMSIGRAFDELASSGLASIEKRGKEKYLLLDVDKRDLLERARPLLRSPVRTIRYCCGALPYRRLKFSGQTALAHYTDLSAPSLEEFAVFSRKWSEIVGILGIEEVEEEFEAEFVVETWAYDPAGLSSGDTVDPLSLYARFHDDPDERLAMAAEDLLERIP